MDRLAARVARRFVAGRVPITIDTAETLAARKRFPLFNMMVVGTFEGSFALYRAFDGPELKRILRTGKITGGKFSAPAERAYGASWGHNITEVIRGLNSERGRRIGADLYLAKIDGLDQRFAHLNPEVDFDPEGPAFQKASLDAKVCSVGLGCSVFVDAHDVDAFYLVRPDHQIEQLKPADLKARVEHIDLEEDEPVKKTPEKVRGTYAIKPKDKFKVDKGSTKLGINANNSGTVLDVYQYDTWLEEGDRRVWVQLAFTWPLKNGDRAKRTLYAIHPNRLQDFDGAGVKLHANSSSIVIRRRR
jgi:hypothetical protein